MKRKHAVIFLMALFAFLAVLPMKADAAWKKVDGKYVYYDTKGKIVTNRKIGKYYVGKDGTRYINRWKGKDFYGENGKVIPGFKGGWYTIGGKRYYYTSKGKKVTGWLRLKGKKYLLDEKGVLQMGWRQVNGSYYYLSKSRKTPGAVLKGFQEYHGKTFYLAPANGRLKLGWFTVDNKKYYATTGEGIYTGLKDIDGQTYLFTNKGKLQKGWCTYMDNRYYCTRGTGAIAKGLGSIGGKLYYFDQFGVMQKNTVVTVNDTSYSINSSGVCTKIATSAGTPDDLIFFTLYESGLDGYGQVGGDNGNACGKYQFDRRFSLIPLVKYCYEADPVVFAPFAKYAKWSNTQTYWDKLKGNTKFYAAWTSIYEAYPYVFKNYQDAFALKEYYTPVERQLKNWGIDLSDRPYVIRGAVFSYSIQHGQSAAAYAVKNAGIKNSTSDEKFIRKLYEYRIKTFPAYVSRYSTEMRDALKRL